MSHTTITFNSSRFLGNSALCSICCSGYTPSNLSSKNPTWSTSPTTNIHYDSNRLTKATEKIFKYLLIPKKHFVKVKKKKSLLSFCPKCMEIVKEIIELQNKAEILELQIKWKVETLGRNAINTPGFTRKDRKALEEVSNKFKANVKQNFRQGLLPNPSVRLDKTGNVETKVVMQLEKEKLFSTVPSLKSNTNSQSFKTEAEVDGNATSEGLSGKNTAAVSDTKKSEMRGDERNLNTLKPFENSEASLPKEDQAISQSQHKIKSSQDTSADDNKMEQTERDKSNDKIPEMLQTEQIPCRQEEQANLITSTQNTYIVILGNNNDSVCWEVEKEELDSRSNPTTLPPTKDTSVEEISAENKIWWWNTDNLEETGETFSHSPESVIPEENSLEPCVSHQLQKHNIETISKNYETKACSDEKANNLIKHTLSDNDMDNTVDTETETQIDELGNSTPSKKPKLDIIPTIPTNISESIEEVQVQKELQGLIEGRDIFENVWVAPDQWATDLLLTDINGKADGRVNNKTIFNRRKFKPTKTTTLSAITPPHSDSHKIKKHTKKAKVRFVKCETNIKIEGENKRGEQDKSHLCKMCHKGFKSKDAMNVHVRIHTGERPFACTDCDMKFRQKAHLTKHCRSIHAAKAKNNCESSKASKIRAQM